MIEFRIEIADSIFDIRCNFEATKIYCEDYLSNKNADYIIAIEEADIAYEKQMNVLDASDQFLENLAVYRKIAERLIDNDIILFHSSIIELDGKAYVFSAPSGTGKTTHTRLWREFFAGKEIHMVNDDKPLIRIDKDIIAYGTPWRGKENIGENRKAIVKSICFLKQGDQNEIRMLSKKESFPLLFKQVYRSKDRGKLAKTIQLLNQITEKLDIFEMNCTISYDAVKLAFEHMNGMENL